MVLFDFEDGASGWFGNPWGGGESGAEEDSRARFGKKCLRGWFRNVKRGASVVGPDFPEDAAWRSLPWAGIAFYYRGDGSPEMLVVHLETRKPESQGWSRSVPLENRTWQRVYLPFHSFWNRRKMKFHPERLRRIYFAARGTHEFLLDQVELIAPHRVLCVDDERWTANSAGPPPQWLQFRSGRIAVRWAPNRPAADPTGGVRLTAVLRLGNAVFTGVDSLTGGSLYDRELFAVLDPAAAREGRANIEATLSDERGRRLGRHTGAVHIFLPGTIQERFGLPVLPLPKQAVAGTGFLNLPARCSFRRSGPDRDPRPLRLLRSELRRGWAVELAAADAGAPVFLLHCGKPLPDWVADSAREAIERHPREGCFVDTRSRGVRIAALEAHGLYNGVQTFLQLLRADSPAAAAPRVRRITITDWPSLPWRALTMNLPTDRWGYPNRAPVPVDFFNDFIRTFVARHKFNAVVLGINAGFRYPSHPEIACRVAWSPEELRRFVEVCREHFIEPVPFVNSYGHTGWLTLRHPELREDGDLNTLCVRHPDAFKILTDLYGDLLDVFGPVRFFHIGMDEVRWKTLTVPPEKRCKRCAGVPKHQLFAEHVRRLHDWLVARGIRTMMWGDMLLPEHNGHAPFHCARALPLLPRDIIIANWSFSLAQDSNFRFHRLGFTVWQSNSRGLSRSQTAYCEGNMFGTWNKLPWISDNPWRSGQSFTWLNYPIAAQYSWNLWPDIETLAPPLDAELLARLRPGWEHDTVRPVPAGGPDVFHVAIPANYRSTAADSASPDRWFGADPMHDLRNLPRGNVTVLGMPFRILPATGPDCVRPPENGSEVRVPVGRTAAELRFLHTGVVPKDREEALAEAFKKPEFWAGIPIGTYTVYYADGEKATHIIRYMADIKRWDMRGRIPYTYASAGFLTASTAAAQGEKDVCVYVGQWVNPRPDVPIRAVGFRSPPDAPAVPVLFAVSGREVRRNVHQGVRE